MAAQSSPNKVLESYGIANHELTAKQGLRTDRATPVASCGLSARLTSKLHQTKPIQLDLANV
jgi:hypothetical protein